MGAFAITVTIPTVIHQEPFLLKKEKSEGSPLGRRPIQMSSDLDRRHTSNEYSSV